MPAEAGQEGAPLRLPGASFWCLRDIAFGELTGHTSTVEVVAFTVLPVSAPAPSPSSPARHHLGAAEAHLPLAHSIPFGPPPRSPRLVPGLRRLLPGLS